MSDRPTPETDALDCELHNPRLVQDRYSEMLEHARRLERERDEAREELARVRKDLVSANRGAETNAHINNSLCSKLIQAERERDEARTIAKMAYIRMTGLGVSNHTPIQFMRDAIKQFDKEQKEEA